MKNIPSKLARLVFGYRESRIVLTALELDIFTAIGGGSKVRDIAHRTGASVRGLAILLDALAALGLVRKVGNRFHNTELSRDFLVEGGPQDASLGLRHHARLWTSWSRLTEVVRQGRPLPRDGRDSPPATEAFIGLMERLGAVRAPRLAKAVDLHDVSSMLDVGGGSGVYSAALVRKKPSLRVTLFDRPAVIPLSERYVTKAGLRANFTFRSGDMTVDDFGRGFGLVLISSICHQFSPDENRALIKKAYDALAPGGRLAAADFVLNENRTEPENAAVFAVNMLVNTQRGNSYSVSEYREWIKKAGFRKLSFRRLVGGQDLFLARK